MAASRRILACLPALLGAAVIALGAAQIVWNGTIARAVPLLHWHVKIPLGAVPDNPPTLSAATLLDGAWQHYAAHAVGPETVLYRIAVSWKNQFYYSVFGTTGVQEIGIGHGGELFQWIYVRTYCRSDLADMRARAPAAAARMRALQDRFVARGQAFLYVITPSKVTQNPWIVPTGYPCPHGTDAPARRAAWLAALTAAGVHAVDTAAPLEQARGRYPVPLFPRGGMHWNALGAALGAQSLTRAADADGARLTPFTFSVAASAMPEGDDRDLYDALNLVEQDDHYPVPLMAYQSTAPAPCRRERIAEVAGSFIFRLNEALEAASCPPDIRLFWYWDTRAFAYANGKRQTVALVPEQRADDILRWAELVVLEENEAMIPASAHGDALMRLMSAEIAAAR